MSDTPPDQRSESSSKPAFESEQKQAQTKTQTQAQDASLDETAVAVKKTGLLRSSLLVSSMTMLSRVLGLLRDMCIAIMVGATANADAFFIAFKVPQFLRRLFSEGAFSQAFVPVLSEYREQRDFAAVKALLDRVAASLGSVLIMVCGLAVVGAPWLTAVFAPGFLSDPDKYALTASLIQITFPYLLFISMAGFAGAILNSYGRFAVPAFTPVILNLCLITGAVWGVDYFQEPVMALAWAVFVAGLAQFLFQLPFLANIHLLPSPKWDWQDDGVRRILTLMLPALFGVSVSQINLLLDTVLASFLPTGSVSWLYFSDRLVELPLGVFAIAVSTVILPSLSRKHANANQAEFQKTLDWSMRMILLISLPAALALFMLAEPLLATLFYYGEAFTESDITMAALSLQAYSLGLLPFMAIKVLAPGYYAQLDMKTPVKIGIIAMFANMLLNLLLVLPLHYYWQIGHVGLALATGLSALLNAGLLLSGLLQKQVYAVQPGFYLLLLRAILASAALAAFLYFTSPDAEFWLSQSWQGRVLPMLGLVLGGICVYALSHVLLGLRLKDIRSPVSH
ncbi:MAG: murein biosynthesis integral membrane protein MurJ [Pseudomonadales bacterium]|nr:murein biosynthesis integral membrane protein MurJ [Pseudomonadales bacterium]